MVASVGREVVNKKDKVTVMAWEIAMMGRMASDGISRERRGRMKMGRR